MLLCYGGCLVDVVMLRVHQQCSNEERFLFIQNSSSRILLCCGGCRIDVVILRVTVNYGLGRKVPVLCMM